jgi:Xaa-Pro dipeptidase
MIEQRLQQLLAEMRGQEIDHVLLTSLASLRYFAGYSADIETGPSPFAPLMGAFLATAGEPPTLLLADMESSEDLSPGVSLSRFESYTVDKPLAALEHLANKLVERFKTAPRCNVGIESACLPVTLLERLRSSCTQLNFQDVTSLTERIRMIKDDQEISLIREALALCDLGQGLTKNLARPGATEIELLVEVRKAMEIRAAARVPLLADIVSGPRTAQVGGPPTSRILGDADLVISDLVPRYKGYWGDTCNTCAVGEPNKEHQRAFRGITTALADGIDSVRPGIRACDLDARLRKNVRRLNARYPHHSGHGIGVTFHEEPRIVPYNQLPLQTGMVIALEPGIYFTGRFGLRLEHTILVTSTGAEILSKFQHTL